MQKYLVILHDALENSQAGRAELKESMRATLKLSEKTVDNIFEALPVIIRRDLEKNVAERYAEALEKLGAVVEAIGYDSEEELEKLFPTDRLNKNTSLVSEKAQTIEEEEEFGIDLAEEKQSDSNLVQFDFEEDLSSPTLNQRSSTPDLLFVKEGVDPSVLTAQVISAAPKESSSETSAKIFEKPNVPPTEEEIRNEADSAQLLDEASLRRAYAGTQAIENLSDDLTKLPKATSFFGRSGKTPVISAVLILGLIACVGTPFFLSLFQGSEPSMKVSFDVQALLKEQRSILGLDRPKLTDLPPPQVSGKWNAESSVDGKEVSLHLLELDKIIALGKFELATPEPAKLTAEELVNGKEPPVWLKKLESDSLRIPIGPPLPPEMLKEADSDARPFVLFGNAKAYIEDISGSDRIIAQIELRIPRSELLNFSEDSALHIGWRVWTPGSLENLGPAGTQANEQNRFAYRDKSKHFQLMLQGELLARRTAVDLGDSQAAAR